MARGLATGLALFFATATSADFLLASPIDCTLGDTCYIQQYVDRDPGPGAQDFMCQGLSYDGHKGTDFALPTFADLEADVAVLAAADGIVTATRDEMADALPGREVTEPIEGRECGNGVVLRHGDGWETQYCHLALGSVTVRPGDTVTAGDTLGMVGLSGQTEFPHLHLSVRRNGAVIDPFAPDGGTICGPTDETLWSDPLIYAPGGLLRIGLSGGPPLYDNVRAGAPLPGLRTDAPLVGWALFFGARDGDSLTITIHGPDGEMHSSVHELEQNALGYQFSGRRAPNATWPSGDYSLTVALIRNDAPFSSLTTTVPLP